MPRASDGQYSLPAGTLVNSGDVVLPSQHNPAFNDVASALTGSLARNGSGGMLDDLNLNGNDLLNIGNVEAQGTVTAQGDITAANLNIVAGNQVRFGAAGFYAQAIAGTRRFYTDATNQNYIDDDGTKFRMFRNGVCIASYTATDVIFRGTVTQNGNPT